MNVMERNPCRGWKNGDVVMYPAADGSVLMLGKVVIRRGLDSGKPFLKVQITSGGQIGKWVWPEGWVIGQGPASGNCLDCEQPYRNDGRSRHCPPCDRAFEAEHQTPETIRSLGGFMLDGGRGRRKARPLTEEEQAERAEQKAKDEQESPY